MIPFNPSIVESFYKLGVSTIFELFHFPFFFFFPKGVGDFRVKPVTQKQFHTQHTRFRSKTYTHTHSATCVTVVYNKLPCMVYSSMSVPQRTAEDFLALPTKRHTSMASFVVNNGVGSNKRAATNNKGLFWTIFCHLLTLIRIGDIENPIVAN